MAATARREGRVLVEGRGKIPQGFTFQQIVQRASATAVAATRRKVAIQQYVKQLPPTEKSQYESFRRKGHTPESASTLTAWSTEHQMSPTKDVIARVLAGEKVLPVPKVEVKRVERPPTPAVIREEGGAVFTPAEAIVMGITPTATQKREGAVFVPEQELRKRREERIASAEWKPGDPLIRFEPEKTKLVWEALFKKPSERVTDEQIFEFEERTSFEDLAEKGMWASVIRKAFRVGGKKYVGGIDTALVHITGKPPMPESEITKWGIFFGESALFLFFSPVFKTGAYKKQEQTIQKQISKTQFDKLSKQLGGIERKLLKQKTLKGQLQILKGIKDKLKTPTELKNFEKFLLYLKDKQIFRTPIYEIVPAKVPVKEVPIMFAPTPPKIPVTPIFIGARYGAHLQKQKQKKVQVEQGKVNDLQKQITIQKTKLAQAQTSYQKTIQKQKLSQLQRQLQKQRQKLGLAQLQLQKYSQIQKQIQKQRQKYLMAAPQILKLKLRLKPRLKPRIKPRLKPPRLKPKRLPRLPLPFFIPKKIPKAKVIRKPKKVPLVEGGYHALVKSRGKFRKVNLVPLKKSKAKDLGAFLTDRSTARTFKTIQVPFKSEKPKLKVPSDYFQKQRRKFRGRKIKGKIQPIKKIVIEKSKYAIDTSGEKKGLSLARVRAKLLKKYGLRKVKKKSTGKMSMSKKSMPPKLKSTSLIKLKKR